MAATVTARAGTPVRIEHWRNRAACRLMPAEMFFPVGSSGLAAEQVTAARSVCARCDVAAPCLEFAITTRQEFGVWGGTDEEERRSLLRSARRSGG